MAPPPPAPATLFENVQLLTINVPPLAMAPPSPALPLVRVRSCRVSVADPRVASGPAGTTISCTVPPPLIVMPGEPVGPMMARLVSVIEGKVLPSVMVPVSPLAKMILSLFPLPAVQFVEPEVFWPLALVIAWRRLQVPRAPVGSARVVTVIVAARDNLDIARNKSGNAVAASVKRRFKPGIDPSPRGARGRVSDFRPMNELSKAEATLPLRQPTVKFIIAGGVTDARPRRPALFTSPKLGCCVPRDFDSRLAR